MTKCVRRRETALTFRPDISGTWRFLSSELEKAEQAGEAAWVIGHVTPAWDGSNALPNPSDVFTQIINRFSPHVVRAVFFGHTHEDQISVYYRDNSTVISADTANMVQWTGPSITPLTGLNSGFRACASPSCAVPAESTRCRRRQDLRGPRLVHLDQRRGRGWRARLADGRRAELPFRILGSRGVRPEHLVAGRCSPQRDLVAPGHRADGQAAVAGRAVVPPSGQELGVDGQLHELSLPDRHTLLHAILVHVRVALGSPLTPRRPIARQNCIAGYGSVQRKP